MQTSVTGGCLCGAIRYTITSAISGLRACHCANCQKSSGHSGTVNAVVPTESFKLAKGAPKKYDDAATKSGRLLSRFFCGDCGSPIYSSRNPNPGFVVVRAGTLDDSGGFRITGNIWTSSARMWAFIDPSTECRPENIPNVAPK